MEVKTGKELLSAIHDENGFERRQDFEGSDVWLVQIGNCVYYVGSESGTDFHDFRDLLNNRQAIIGNNHLMEELDTNPHDLFEEFCTSSTDSIEDFCQSLVESSYHCEDLSLC